MSHQPLRQNVELSYSQLKYLAWVLEDRAQNVPELSRYEIAQIDDLSSKLIEATIRMGNQGANFGQMELLPNGQQLIADDEK